VLSSLSVVPRCTMHLENSVVCGLQLILLSCRRCHSLRYRGFSPSRSPAWDGLLRRLASWELAVHIRKITFVFGANEVLKVGGSAAANSVSALVYVLVLALQLIVGPYEESSSNLVRSCQSQYKPYRRWSKLTCRLSSGAGMQAESLSLAAVLGILVLAPWLAKEGGGLEDFLELTVLLLLGLVSALLLVDHAILPIAFASLCSCSMAQSCSSLTLLPLLCIRRRWFRSSSHRS
jgi:hypothetical protein